MLDSSQEKRRARRREQRRISGAERVRLLSEFHQIPDDAFVSELYAAAYQDCSRATVQADRVNGKGVPFLKDESGRVRYVKKDIVSFCAAKFRRFESTSQYLSAYCADVRSPTSEADK